MADVIVARKPADGAMSGPGVIALFQEGEGNALPAPCAFRESCRIGRDECATVSIDDPQASRVHVQIELAGAGFVVTDLQSQNGTFLNGARVVSPRTPAATNAMVRIGKTLFRLVSDVAPFVRHPLQTSLPFIGGPALAPIRQFAQEVISVTEPLLIEGETGTGKEHLARAIHDRSGAAGAFVIVDCAGITRAEQLVDPHDSRSLHAARGGTWVLDNIGKLAQPIQAALLQHIGSASRLIAVTNENLDKLAARGRFLPELLDAIRSRRLTMPALRSHGEDVPALAAHFLPSNVEGLAVESMELLLGWHWPRNLHELRDVMLTASARAAMDNTPRILPAHLPNAVLLFAQGPDTTLRTTQKVDDRLMRAHIETALSLRGGDVDRVARDLGHDRQWLDDTMRRLGIDVGRFRR